MNRRTFHQLLAYGLVGGATALAAVTELARMPKRNYQYIPSLAVMPEGTFSVTTKSQRDGEKDIAHLVLSGEAVTEEAWFFCEQEGENIGYWISSGESKKNAGADSHFDTDALEQYVFQDSANIWQDSNRYTLTHYHLHPLLTAEKWQIFDQIGLTDKRILCIPSTSDIVSSIETKQIVADHQNLFHGARVKPARVVTTKGVFAYEANADLIAKYNTTGRTAIKSMMDSILDKALQTDSFEQMRASFREQGLMLEHFPL